MGEEEITKTLETLISKIEELANIIKEEKETVEETVEETEKEVKLIEKLSIKMDECMESIKERKVIAEEKIKENPVAYITGAFTGGIIIGFLIGKGKGSNQ